MPQPQPQPPDLSKWRFLHSQTAVQGAAGAIHTSTCMIVCNLACCYILGGACFSRLAHSSAPPHAAPARQVERQEGCCLGTPSFSGLKIPCTFVIVLPDSRCSHRQHGCRPCEPQCRPWNRSAARAAKGADSVPVHATRCQAIGSAPNTAPAAAAAAPPAAASGATRQPIGGSRG